MESSGEYMSKSSLKSNFFYQIFYQLVQMISPFITIPLISHALGPNNVGKYGYIQSIVTYFVFLAGLGMRLYGQREIARVRNDRIKLVKKFSELFSLQVISSTIAVFGYVLLAFIIGGGNLFYYLILVFMIFSIFIDTSWFFMGMERFKITSLINIIVMGIVVALVILFIRHSTDLLLYFMIMSFASFAPSLFLIPFIMRGHYFKLPKFKNVISHFFPVVQYFFPIITVVFYATMNKTMLGIFSTNSAVAYFTNAMSIMSIPVAITAAIDTILLSRLSNLLTEGKKNDFFAILKKSLNIEFYLTSLMFFGIILIAEKFVPWFFGNSFGTIKYVLPALALQAIVVPMGTSIARQYLIPIDNIRVYNKSVFAGAAVGLAIALIFVPLIGVWGAVIAINCSEIFVTAVRTVSFIKETNFKYDVKAILKYFISGLVMFIITWFMTRDMSASFVTTFTQIILGGGIYFVCTILLKENPITKLKTLNIEKRD